MINKRIATAVATGALLLNSFATPAFAATTITLSGNGSDSTNNATINLTKTATVVQNNTANVTNKVDVEAETGDNDANDNTGGDVNIKTGDSDVAVAVKNMLNMNSASIDCCAKGDTSVKIADNGSDSDNDVDLDWTSSNGVYQDNDADVDNKVYVDGDTGDNDANDNTNGDVSVETGDSEVSVGVLNFLNSNFAKIGGGDDEGSSLSLWILGNGSNSDNYIDADLENENVVTQDNAANVDNKVDVEAETGDNDANDNTGGEVSIETGDADVEALVANVGNFNWAELGCDCLFDDLTAKIADNGSDTDNDIDLDLSDGKNNGVFQDNGAYLDNDLDELEAQTGDNEAEDNTGGSEGNDPAIETGDAGVEAEVVNQFNSNTAGIGGDFEFEFDWEELLGSIFG
jgi:hypothetical protein